MNADAIAEFRKNLRPLLPCWSALRVKWVVTKTRPSSVVALQAQPTIAELRASGDLLSDANTVEVHDDIVDIGYLASILDGVASGGVVLGGVARRLVGFSYFSVVRNYAEQAFSMDQELPNLWLRSYGSLTDVDMASIEGELRRVGYSGLADATKDLWASA